MQKITSITVFCGASSGKSPEFKSAADDLGQELASRNIRLVYGGGSVGLMGAIADSVLKHGGKVLGVIPQKLATKEIAHSGLTELKVVKDMHERKQIMASECQAFIAMPGGFGTLEETFEAITWSQLGIHAKSVGLLNVCNYFNPLIDLVNNAVEAGFIRKEQLQILLDDSSPSKLLDNISSRQLPDMEKWLMPEQF